jgi:hypothetical protein
MKYVKLFTGTRRLGSMGSTTTNENNHVLPLDSGISTEPKRRTPVGVHVCLKDDLYQMKDILYYIALDTRISEIVTIYCSKVLELTMILSERFFK